MELVLGRIFIVLQVDLDLVCHPVVDILAPKTCQNADQSKRQRGQGSGSIRQKSALLMTVMVPCQQAAVFQGCGKIPLRAKTYRSATTYDC